MSRDQFQGAQRIVCLIEETTETLYLLGEEARIAGISGFTVRPPQAHKEKPKISGFNTGSRARFLRSTGPHRGDPRPPRASGAPFNQRRAPDIIIGSWCGKRVGSERVQTRAGWNAIPAVQTGSIFEIKSADLLKPGPATISDGLAQIRRIMRRWSEETVQ